MTPIRRLLLLTAATGAVVGGVVVPAHALFEDVEYHSGSVATTTVAPPTSVAVSTACDGVSATVTVSWTGSANPRHAGYRVVLSSPALASPVVADTGTAARSATVVADQAAVDGTGTVTVATLTSTVWTGVSAPTPPVTCPPPPAPEPAPEPAPAPTDATSTQTEATPAPVDESTTATEPSATATEPAAVAE